VLLATIVFFLIIFDYILKTTDTSSSKGLSIEVVEAKRDEKNKILLLKYKISNLGDYVKHVPSVKFFFSDYEANIVDFHISEEKVILEPHNYIYITSRFQDSSKKIENFDIKF